jgi:acylphosphatase
MPVVFADAQTVTNADGQYAVVQGSLGSGYVYIILDGVAQANVAEMDAAVAAGNGAKAASTESYANIQIPTYAITPGTYYAYLADAAGNVSEKGENTITVTDGIAPEVSASVQSVDNGADSEVFVQSNEDNGKVYIILDGENQTVSADFITAVALNKAATANVTAANTDISVSAAGLETGIYYAYAFDAAGNISEKGTSPINITEAVSVENATQSEIRVLSREQRIILMTDDGTEISEVSIYDLTGRRVEHSGCSSSTFESDRMNSGVYFLKIKSGSMEFRTIKVYVN